jgi:chromosome segregation and condensation protein ScpB
MSVHIIYETALRQLANQGNEVAQAALAMGKAISQKEPAISKAVAHLRNSINHSSRALEHNGNKWTHATDDCIRNSIDEVTAAISALV